MITTKEQKKKEEEEIYESATKRTYIKGKELGKGAFAKVFKFIDKETQHVYAVKVIELSKISNNKATATALMNEKDINKKIDFNYICQFVQFFNDKSNYYIVMEYYPNKTLAELLKTRKMLSEFEVKYYGYQLLLAMEYLHAKSIIHRDIKLSNILLSSEMEVKLCDFGLAVENSLNQKRKSVCGTPNYIAPEVLVNGKKARHRVGYGLEVDIWSFGVVIYTLLCGKPPFEGKDNKDIEFNIINNKYAFPRNDLTEEAKSIIQQMLVTNPEQRIKLSDIKGSAFFNNGKNIPRTLPTSTLKTPLTDKEIEALIEQAKDNPYSDSEEIEEKSQSTGQKEANKSGQHLESSSIYSPFSAGSKAKSPEFPIKKQLIPSKDQDMPHPRCNSAGRYSLNTYATSKPNPANRNMVNIFNHAIKPITREDNKEAADEEVTIINFIDYSNKYGVGYLLSNSNTGVYFNDGTKMLFDSSSQVLYSISKDGSIAAITQKPYPKELETKVKLLELFKQALLLPQKQKMAQCGDDGLVYVRKWQKKEQASFYLFSNKTIQVIFKDRTELFFVFNKNEVKYVNANRDSFVYGYNSPQIQLNAEMNKKVAYAKQILASS